MDAAIVFRYYGYLNGSLLDCFECYLYCRILGLPVGFIILDDSGTHQGLKLLRKIYEERFSTRLPDLKWEDGVHFVPGPKALFFEASLECKRLVVFDYVTASILQPWLSGLPPCLFISNSLHSDAYQPVGFTEVWCERPEDMVGTRKYNMKFLFDYYPSKEHRNPIAPLMCCPGVYQKQWYEVYQKGWYFAPDSIEAKYVLASMTGCAQRVYYKSSSKDVYNNLLSHMSELLYFQSPYVYDRKPRIFVEAFFYDVKTCYFPLAPVIVDSIRGQISTRKDGSNHRYEDLQAHGLNNRLYVENDNLILWIAGERV